MNSNGKVNKTKLAELVKMYKLYFG